MTTPTRRVKYLAKEINERCGTQILELLSVSATRGVIPRSQITSDEPRADDLSNYKICRPGDIVVNRMSAYQGALGSTSCKGIVSPDYLVLRPSSHVQSRWLHYLMKSSWFVSDMSSRLRGIGSIGTSNVRTPRVSAEEIGEIAVSVPTFEAQRAIADYLDTETARIDALIEKKQRMIALLEERRVAIVDTAVMSAHGPLRPISALAKYINGWPFKPGDFTATGTPVIRIAQLTDPELEQDLFDGELPEKVTLRDGDLVFSWSGSLQVQRWTRGRAYLNQHLFRVLAAEGVDTDWLTHALETATRLFDEHMHGSAMTHITQPMMKLVKVPLPTFARQKEIAVELDRACVILDRVVELLLTQLKLLGEQRRAFITAAVTGELEIPAVAA